MTGHKSCVKAAALLWTREQVCLKEGQYTGMCRAPDADCCMLTDKFDAKQLQTHLNLYMNKVLEVAKVKLC